MVISIDVKKKLLREFGDLPFFVLILFSCASMTVNAILYLLFMTEFNVVLTRTSLFLVVATAIASIVIFAEIFLIFIVAIMLYEKQLKLKISEKPVEK